MVREIFVNDGHGPGRPAWSVAANGVRYAAALALSAHSSATHRQLASAAPLLHLFRLPFSIAAPSDSTHPAPIFPCTVGNGGGRGQLRCSLVKLRVPVEVAGRGQLRCSLVKLRVLHEYSSIVPSHPWSTGRTFCQYIQTGSY
jgi:hypothetical protein